MSNLTDDVVGSVLVAVSAVAIAQQLIKLRRAGKARPGVPVWRAVVTEPGYTLRLTVVPLLFGILLLTYWRGQSSAGGWLVVGIMAAVFSWNAVVFVRSRIRRQY